jgi:hypothetical protein
MARSIDEPLWPTALSFAIEDLAEPGVDEAC